MNEDHQPLLNMARFRFYAELNDFLPVGRRQVEFNYPFRGNPAVRDAVEALGVPHTEIDLIIVQGRSVGFDYHLQDGDRVAVYPVFEAFDITPVIRLRPEPLRQTRFILDVHLGKLARLLRLTGFDCAYKKLAEDRQIIEQALAERRIILTRDIGLLKTKSVTHGYWVRSTDPGEQLLEVLGRFDLRNQVFPFSRCSVCNGVIESIDREEGILEAPEKVKAWCSEYFRCDTCRRLYWKGTHYKRITGYISRMLAELDNRIND